MSPCKELVTETRLCLVIILTCWKKVVLEEKKGNNSSNFIFQPNMNRIYGDKRYLSSPTGFFLPDLKKKPAVSSGGKNEILNGK